MNTTRHILVDVICEDIEGSAFNGMKAVCSRAQIDYMNKDAVQVGLTRRWYTLEEYELRENHELSR
jgi:hypothetical protein